MNRLLALVGAVLLAAAPALASDRSRASQQLAFGVQMALKGSWREAAFRFEKSVKVDPDNPFAHNNLGVALESIGKFDQALAAYRRALELDADNPKIRENKERLEAYLESLKVAPKPPGASPVGAASAPAVPAGAAAPPATPAPADANDPADSNAPADANAPAHGGGGGAR